MGNQGQDHSMLLSLPYDIRYLIYQHLFPPTNQLYLQAWSKDYRNFPEEHTIPTPLLQTCRSLHSEGSEYLYNHYLFNILGSKADCLAAHDRFVRTLKKYARDSVYVHALGNGAYSGTMCISLHVGPGKVELMRKRQSGVARRIEDVRFEVEAGSARGVRWSRTEYLWYLVSMGLTVVVGVLAWMMALRRIVQ